MPAVFHSPNGVTIELPSNIRDAWNNIQTWERYRNNGTLIFNPIVPSFNSIKVMPYMHNKKIRNAQTHYYNVMWSEIQRYTMTQNNQIFIFTYPIRLNDDYNIISLRIASNTDNTVYALVRNIHTGEECEEDIVAYTVHELENIAYTIW